MAGTGLADGVAEHDHQTRIQRLINNRQNGRRRGRGGQRSPNPGNTGNRQDNRQRGNAAQLLEKYKALARDAQLAGDRVQTEYFLQFADHYFRVLNEGRARFEEQRRQRDDFGPDEDLDQDEAMAAQDRDDGDERDERPEQFEGRREFRNNSREDNGREDAPREGGDRGYAAPQGRDGGGRDTNARGGGRDNGRDGESRRERPRFRPREVQADIEDTAERISLDVLPPAISANNNSAADDVSEVTDEAPRAPRRRTRRPRPESDEEIAPAA